MLSDDQFAIITAFWKRELGIQSWFGGDVYFTLVRRFVNAVEFVDPADFESLKGRGVLFVGNHQVGLESMMFTMLMSGFHDMMTAAIAKSEHGVSWIGRIYASTFGRDDVKSPKLFVLVDRDDKRHMVTTMAREFELAGNNEQSLLVHTEGTRSLQCRIPVQVVARSLVDRAVKARMPIVPVRFVGGLPVEPLAERIEFPYRYGKFDIVVGKALHPETLEPMASDARRDAVLEAMIGVGEPWELEEPYPGDERIAAEVPADMAARGVDEAQAVLTSILGAIEQPSADTATVLKALRSGTSLPADLERRDWLVRCARDVCGHDGAQ